MERSGHINFAEDLALLDGTGEVVEVGELEGVGEGGLIDLPEVSTGPFGAVGLGLEVERRAPIMTLFSSNLFHNT